MSTTPTDLHFDALVIGAGAGGTTAAALLAHRGYRTLLVEAKERIGGRASTREVDGFLLNTGALAIEIGGPVDQVRTQIGKPLELYVPQPATVLLWGHRVFNAETGLNGWARRSAPQILALAARIRRFEPAPGQSLTDWLNRFTHNKRIHNLADNIAGAFFAAAGSDLPAEVFLAYLSKGSAFKKIGFAPGGTIEVWKPFAEYVAERGGQVWLNSTVESLTFAGDGTVSGALIRRDDRNGAQVTVSAGAVISDIGPLATGQLAPPEALPAGYLDDVRAKTDPSAIITIHFASDKPLTAWSGLALAASSRRLTYAANYSDTAQRRAPQGWYLYSGASTPRPARGEFDLENETALLKADLRDYFPGFNDAEILAVDVTAHDWPAQRAITGYDLPIDTPIHNLWNVGDGVKRYPEAGTSACAATAQLAVAKLTANHPPRPLAATAP
jgi:phytoene dehydrogenase-like protein